jgi:hypothetical protein
MEEEAVGVDEVVIVGYGTMKKVDVTVLSRGNVVELENGL